MTRFARNSILSAILLALIGGTSGVGVAQTQTLPSNVIGDHQSGNAAGSDGLASASSGEPRFSDAGKQLAIGPRRKVIMSMVLDRSGSMSADGGEAALQSAVPTFVSKFNNSFDEVALISFADNAEIDVPIGYNFITPISNAVEAMPFGGGTFGTGAGNGPILSSTEGPPMSLADLQNGSIIISPGQKVVKVMVYFTDGLMNTIQDSFSCPMQVLLNYGGFDFASNGQYGDIFDPSSKTTIFGTASSYGFPYTKSTLLCRNSSGQPVTTFTSQQTGQQEPLLQANITPEAQFRAIYTANAMRTESPVPTYIYTIGLGSSVLPSTQAFLAQLANDPSYPTYIPTQPAGQFFYIPDCPSSSCTAELNTAFQDIASKLLH